MISFVVPAHNEASLIAATIDAIRHAADPLGQPWEVVVADDSSTDGTAAVATDRGARVVRVEHRQIAATRNSGAAVANGEWLIFVDADTLVGADVVAAAVGELERGAVGGGARLAFDGPVPLYGRLMLRLAPLYFSKYAAGCFVFCRRDAFDAVGGFDESLYAAEEITLSNALKRRGRFVIVRPEVITSGRKLRTHTGGETLVALVRAASRRALGRSGREGLDLWYGERRRDPHPPGDTA